MPIRFAVPPKAGKEIKYIKEAIDSGRLAGNGPFTKRCHDKLRQLTEAKKILLTSSGTAALEMAAILCDIGSGDEVIMPSFTFVSTANAFVLRGATPIFVDIVSDTFNIDPAQVEDAVTSKTKAIVPVHYAGMSCEMDVIMALAEKHDLKVIEDAAQALLSSWKKQYLGTVGHLGCVSFHETKNIISGEGGALLINDERFVQRAEIIREKGTDRSRFFRGEVDKYTWQDIGSSYLPSELTAAFLFAQLEEAEKIIAKRRNIYAQYLEFLKPLAQEGHIHIPPVSEDHEENGHLFYILTGSLEERNALMHHLQDGGIKAIFHYVPLHSSPAGKRLCRTSGTTSVTDEMSDRLLRLPLYYDMTEGDVGRVIERISKFYHSK